MNQYSSLNSPPHRGFYEERIFAQDQNMVPLEQQYPQLPEQYKTHFEQNWEEDCSENFQGRLDSSEHQIWNQEGQDQQQYGAPMVQQKEQDSGQSLDYSTAFNPYQEHQMMPQTQQNSDLGQYLQIAIPDVQQPQEDNSESEFGLLIPAESVSSAPEYSDDIQVVDETSLNSDVQIPVEDSDEIQCLAHYVPAQKTFQEEDDCMYLGQTSTNIGPIRTRRTRQYRPYNYLKPQVPVVELGYPQEPFNSFLSKEFNNDAPITKQDEEDLMKEFFMPIA